MLLIDPKFPNFFSPCKMCAVHTRPPCMCVYLHGHTICMHHNGGTRHLRNVTSTRLLSLHSHFLIFASRHVIVFRSNLPRSTSRISADSCLALAPAVEFTRSRSQSTSSGKSKGRQSFCKKLAMKLFSGNAAPTKVPSVPDGRAASPRCNPLERSKASNPLERPKGPSCGHLLLVDDNPICRKLTAAYMEGVPCTVETACDGAVACAMLKERPNAFTGILMDIRMPQMDGIEATRFIRTELKIDVPIIVLSAELGDDLQSALQAGATQCLSKPVKMQELTHVLLEHGSIKGNLGDCHRGAS